MNDQLVGIDLGHPYFLSSPHKFLLRNYFSIVIRLIFTGKISYAQCSIFYFSTSRLFPALYHNLILIITVCQEKTSINQFKKVVCH
jgi:hypothetical protein